MRQADERKGRASRLVGTAGELQGTGMVRNRVFEVSVAGRGEAKEGKAVRDDFLIVDGKRDLERLASKLRRAFGIIGTPLDDGE